MRFCSRAVIHGNVELATEGFVVGDHEFLVVRTPDLPHNSTKRLVEVRTDCEDDLPPIEVALRHYDSVQDLLSAIAILGMCTVKQDSWQTTTIPFAKIGMPFWVVTPANLIRESPCGLTLKGALSEEAWQSIRESSGVATLIRDSLASSNPVEQFRGLTMALENLADDSCEDFQIDMCPICGETWKSTRKATWTYIREQLRRYGVEDKVTRSARSMRAKISHGFSPSSVTKLDELLDPLMKIFGPAMSLVLEKLKLTARRKEKLMVKHPFVCYNFRYEGKGRIAVLPMSMQGTFGWSRIPEHSQVNPSGDSIVGVEFAEGGFPKLSEIHLPIFEDDPHEIVWANSIWNPSN